ncbi:MAG: di-trans,poly-cis-decaprenylcistransferase [Leptospirales bacterium]|nr:di-trans,poly-cis-decaprenylcistransferase [Leptospirales bacterium]
MELSPARQQAQQLLLGTDNGARPRHVAIILDGNGRWATSRGLSRSEGHRAGGETLTRLLDFFIELRVPSVSLYVFSTENWRRPKTEVKAIWRLMNEFFESRLQLCMDLKIRVMASGDLSRLPTENRRRVERVLEMTRRHKRLTVNFCVNYGSQAEILHAASSVLQLRLQALEQGQHKKAFAPISARELERHLYTYPLPPVDLLVRPGGEWRISNFLLWQSAYAEIYVTDTLWPDFTEQHLVQALLWYQSRKRRFGGL